MSYSEQVMKRVRQSLGYEIDDTSHDEEIAVMSRDGLFNRCLEWEGIMGYGYIIRDFVEDIYKVKLTDND